MSLILLLIKCQIFHIFSFTFFSLDILGHAHDPPNSLYHVEDAGGGGMSVSILVMPVAQQNGRTAARHSLT